MQTSQKSVDSTNSTEGNISPQTQKQQQLKREKLASALRANLRRRKTTHTEKGDAEA